MEPVVYLITGPMAAGKSTVARLLASRFERGVHLEGDTFRRSIVNGREEVTPDASPQALRQLRLRYEIAAAAADRYFDAGYSVALEDVAAGPILGDYLAMIRSPCQVVVLLPTPAAISAREAARDEDGYRAWTVEQLYDLFASQTPRIGIWLDTSDQTPEETVEQILAPTSSVPTKGSGPARMRKQYHFWPGQDGPDAWDVDRLVELSRDLPVKEVPLDSIWELDTPYWSRLTVRDVVEHVRLVHAVDLSYPIILGVDGRVMDGMHRVVRALLEGRPTISAVQFDVHPDPDYRNCEPEQLPYAENE